MITAGEGRHRVWLIKQEKLNDDLVYILGGGERPHIGGVVLKVPDQETRVINVQGHYDHHVLVPIAEEASRKYKKTVVVVGGIHIDNASKEDIDRVVGNCKELMKKI